MEFGVWGVVAAGALLVSGVVLGLLLAGGVGTAARLRRLERELADERARHAAYRDGVAKHFAATSDRFRTFTREYTALYAELAEGARSLCPDPLPELGHGLGLGPAAELATGDSPESPAAPAS
jgi:uncharacterized membrane-anchored protein YhcB (DUF1043 family)